MKNHDRTRDRQHEPDELDDVEILEVIGIDDDAPAPSRPSPGDGADGRASREVVLAFDENGDEAPARSGPSLIEDPSWGEPPTLAAEPGRVETELVQRLRADYENLRKRVDRERDDFEHRANSMLITRLLPILDSFERAFAHDASSGNEAALRDGLVLIYQQLREALREAGLQPIRIDGEMFNPELHEAVATDSSSVEPRNAILEEMRRGYLFRERVLRHALVKVSTGAGELDEGGGFP